MVTLLQGRSCDKYKCFPEISDVEKKRKSHKSNIIRLLGNSAFTPKQWCGIEIRRLKILAPWFSDFEQTLSELMLSNALVSTFENKERNSRLNGCCKNKSPTLITTFLPTTSRSFLSCPKIFTEFHIPTLSRISHRLFKTKYSKLKWSSFLPLTSQSCFLLS